MLTDQWDIRIQGHNCLNSTEASNGFSIRQKDYTHAAVKARRGDQEITMVRVSAVRETDDGKRSECECRWGRANDSPWTKST